MINNEYKNSSEVYKVQTFRTTHRAVGAENLNMRSANHMPVGDESIWLIANYALVRDRCSFP